ncbi:MAG TPA: hypothetical protein VK698_28825 [Kofleriaceae bacterium]|nr:hypothetical protein [Kofleriaceae bacterium]
MTPAAIRRAALGVAVAAAIGAAPGRAGADVGPDAEWYLVSGVNVGSVIEEAVADFMLGAEVSAARLFRRGNWYGVYADGLRDFRRDTTRLSLGVEGGYSMVGVDLGPVMELGGDETRFGMRGRLVLTGAWLTVYGGPVIRFGDVGDEERFTGEIGILVKVPIPLQGGQLSPVR